MVFLRSWGRTISMNAALCREIGDGAFPTPRQVLDAGPEALQSRCGVGYRAKTICGLAQQVSNCCIRPSVDSTAIEPSRVSAPCETCGMSHAQLMHFLV